MTALAVDLRRRLVLILRSREQAYAAYEVQILVYPLCKMDGAGGRQTFRLWTGGRSYSRMGIHGSTIRIW